MTLLNEFDRMVFRPGIPVGTYERIRRAIAIAIAQAVEEVLTDWTAAAVQRRADELLKEKK